MARSSEITPRSRTNRDNTRGKAPNARGCEAIVELPAGQEQLIEIRVTPEDRGTTVELTHSGWEQLGDAATSLRERYDRGWGTVFERHFVDYANSAAT